MESVCKYLKSVNHLQCTKILLQVSVYANALYRQFYDRISLSQFSIFQWYYKRPGRFPRNAENYGNDGKFHQSCQILNQTKTYINKICLWKISHYKTVRIKFSVDSGFSNKPYDKKTKTWKRRKSTQSFLNQKASIANGAPFLENC